MSISLMRLLHPVNHQQDVFYLNVLPTSRVSEWVSVTGFVRRMNVSVVFGGGDAGANMLQFNVASNSMQSWCSGNIGGKKF